MQATEVGFGILKSEVSFLLRSAKSPPFGGLGGKNNSKPEFRKRAKLRTGDVIEVFEFKITVV